MGLLMAHPSPAVDDLPPPIGPDDVHSSEAPEDPTLIVERALKAHHWMSLEALGYPAPDYGFMMDLVSALTHPSATGVYAGCIELERCEVCEQVADVYLKVHLGALDCPRPSEEA